MRFTYCIVLYCIVESGRLYLPFCSFCGRHCDANVTLSSQRSLLSPGWPNSRLARPQLPAQKTQHNSPLFSLWFIYQIYRGRHTMFGQEATEKIHHWDLAHDLSSELTKSVWFLRLRYISICVFVDGFALKFCFPYFSQLGNIALHY